MTRRTDKRGPALWYLLSLFSLSACSRASQRAPAFRQDRTEVSSASSMQLMPLEAEPVSETLAPTPSTPLLATRRLNAYFGEVRVIRNVTIAFADREVTAVIGPSGCGKSTLLRCLNRMHETVPTADVEGDVLLDGTSIYKSGLDAIAVRRQIGMVFQRPTPFPTMSIRDNVAAGLRILGRDGPSRKEADEIVEESLNRAG